MASIPAGSSTPIVLPVSRAALLLGLTVLGALLVYYFVGIDQGATSLFGNDTHVHEFVHDARHFLGFPLPLSHPHPIMETKLIARGLLAGALGGLLAFVFARIFAEPQIQAAIDYESGRDAVQDALNQAAGAATEPAGPEVFSRAVQANLGIGVGMVLFGIAMGALFAVVYTVSLGRVGRVRARVLALLVAGGGFLTLYLVPFVKYPANPPAIGHEETINTRSGLYLIMVAGSILFLLGALWLGRRLAPRVGNWNATLIAAAGFVALAAILVAVLPPLGHLATNVAEYGTQATETPLPLKNPAGKIVYPGFPADTLFQFRVNSVIAQLILWGTIGLVFGPLAERALARATGRADRVATQA